MVAAILEKTASRLYSAAVIQPYCSQTEKCTVSSYIAVVSAMNVRIKDE